MRIVLIDIFSMKRVFLLLFVIGLTLFFSVGKLFAEDIGNNIEDNIENNLKNNMEKYVETNIDNNSENNSENNLENNASQEIEVITKDTNNKNEKFKPSLKDIFGDDQTFPFVAGFGKD